MNSSNVLDLGSATEKSWICPGCSLQIYDMKDGYAYCQTCVKKYCSDCKDIYHSPLTCQQYKDAKDISPEERQTRLLFEKKGYKQCPKCSTMIERQNQYNVIRCNSPICQDQYCFCYLCEESFTSKDHFSHYDGRDPWGYMCEGLRKLLSYLLQVNSFFFYRKMK